MGFTRENKAEIKDIVRDAITTLLADEQFINKIADRVCEKLNKRFDELKKECENKIAEVSKKCEEKVDELEQYTRRNNVRIFGIPEDNNEDLEDKVINLCQSKGNILIKPEYIDRIHRLGPQKDGFHRPIIIKFVSYKYRRILVNNKKNFAGSKIVVKEDLTKNRHNLLKYAGKKLGYRNVWTLDGVIKAKFENKIWSIKTTSLCDDIAAGNI